MHTQNALHRKELNEVFKRELPECFFVIRTQINGDYDKIAAYFREVMGCVGEGNDEVAIARSGDNAYIMVVPPDIEVPFKNAVSQEESFLDASIRVDNLAVAGETHTFFGNSAIDISFKKTQGVWEVVREVISTFGFDHLERNISSAYKLFKQLNLELNFNSISSLPASAAEAVNKLFAIPQTEKDFDFGLVGENVSGG